MESNAIYYKYQWRSFEKQIEKVIDYIEKLGFHGHKNYAKRTSEGLYLEGECFDYEIFLPNRHDCFDAKECNTDTFPLANIHEHQVEFMRCFEKQDGVAFILISYTHRNEYYYLTFKKLTEFWDRAAEGGRKSFRYEELEPAFFLPEVPGILVPYLNALQLDLNCRA